jgi:hypothetical protein
VRSGVGLVGLLVAVAAAAACRPEPTVLQRVDDAPRYESAEHLVVVGRAVGDKLIDYHWTRQPPSTARSGRRAEAQACRTQMVPVVDDDWTPSQPIAMWLIRPDEGICDDGEFAPWLARLRSEFDGERVTVKVVDHAGASKIGSRSMWDDALDTASTHGLKVKKGGAVVVWPSIE